MRGVISWLGLGRPVYFGRVDCRSAPPTRLSKPSLVGEFSDWARRYKTPTGQVGLHRLASQNRAGRGQARPRVLPHHRPGDNVRNEVNTIIGYAFKKASTATLTIDGDDFSSHLGDGAWSDLGIRPSSTP
jgi:hypothetical protein